MQTNIDLVPFLLVKYFAQSGFVFRTEIALSFNRQYIKEHHTESTVDYLILPFSTRLLNVGYMF